ncbi:MAG: transposase [Pseudomonadales bacterium]|jgi:transposase-like protein|nr:transposase [Pseudomonadales bacterium]
MNADLQQFFQLIPNEEAARLYIETKRWSGTPVCTTCSSTNVAECKDHRPLPYRCRDCRKHFSVRTGIALAGSRTELQKWLQIIYVLTSRREGIASNQLAEVLEIDERTTRALAYSIHDLLLSDQQDKKLRRTRRHGIIDPIDAGFDAVVDKLVVNRLSPPPANTTFADEVAGYEYERVKGTLRAVFRALLTVELRTWEGELPDEMWQKFRNLTQWRDSLQSRPQWWNTLVAELLYESLDAGVVRYLLALKPEAAALLAKAKQRYGR